MKFTLLLCVALSMILSPAPITANPTPQETSTARDEDAAIREAVVELYIKGLKTRDFALIERICVPETKLMSAGDAGELRVTTLERWSRKFDPENPPFEKLDFDIPKVDRRGTAAQVKIDFVVDSERRVTDFLHMLKLDGEWRIVNIIDF